MSLKQILVIDDEVKFREMYKHFFQSIGYDVLVASNAREAFHWLGHNNIDIILLDIKMTEIDGSVLFKQIKESYKNPKIIVTSVYSVHEQKERIKNADGYFDKSDDKGMLQSIMSSFLLESGCNT